MALGKRLSYLLFRPGVSLRASSPFGGVARSHAKAARECKGATLSRLLSLATQHGELASRLAWGQLSKPLTV